MAGTGMTNDSARAMWMAFMLEVAAPGHRLLRVPPAPGVWAFGNSPEMADELVELVLSGRKRATAGSLDCLLYDGDPMPQPGEHSVILDGSGSARCIIRTTEVSVAALNEVSARFAAREGEGDGSLAYWLEGHRRFFAQEHAERELPFHDAIPVILESFTVVWPREICDTPA